MSPGESTKVLRSLWFQQTLLSSLPMTVKLYKFPVLCRFTYVKVIFCNAIILVTYFFWGGSYKDFFKSLLIYLFVCRCTAVNCSLPVIQNGTILTLFPSNPSVAQVSCIAGYKVFGYATTICQGTKFRLPPASCHG